MAPIWYYFFASLDFLCLVLLCLALLCFALFTVDMLFIPYSLSYLSFAMKWVLKSLSHFIHTCVIHQTQSQTRNIYTCIHKHHRCVSIYELKTGRMHTYDKSRLPQVFYITRVLIHQKTASNDLQRCNTVVNIYQLCANNKFIYVISSF